MTAPVAVTIGLPNACTVGSQDGRGECGTRAAQVMRLWLPSCGSPLLSYRCVRHDAGMDVARMLRDFPAARIEIEAAP